MQNPLQVHQQIPQHFSVLRNSPAPIIQHASAPDCCRQRPCRRASQPILGQRQTVPRRCSALSYFALNCCCFGSYVGGFSASCDVEMLTKVFSRFGNVPLPSQASHHSSRIPCTSRVTRHATARLVHHLSRRCSTFLFSSAAAPPTTCAALSSGLNESICHAPSSAQTPYTLHF